MLYREIPQNNVEWGLRRWEQEGNRMREKDRDEELFEMGKFPGRIHSAASI